MSTHQLSDETQSATEFNTASPVQSSNQLGDMFRSMLKAVRVGFNVPPNTL